MAIYYFLPLMLPLALTGALTRARDANLAALAVIVVVAVAICGLRWDADVDHMGYALLFDETPLLTGLSPEAISELYGEPGYLFVNSVFRSAGIGFFALTFASALFAILVKAMVITRFVRAAGVVLFLYLCIHFVTIEFIQIRWAIASALIALAFLFQCRDRPGPMLLCLALAFSFHYFSVVFVLVALLVAIRNETYLYRLLILIAVGGSLVVAGGFEIPDLVEGDAYIVNRALRYLTESFSTIGPMSYLKLAVYPVGYYLLTFGAPGLHADTTTTFLRKLSFTCVSITLMLSVVPVMHHRAVVLADLFSLMLLVRIIELRFATAERLTILLLLAIPFCCWFVLDVGTNISGNTLYEYQTWLPLIL